MPFISQTWSKNLKEYRESLNQKNFIVKSACILSSVVRKWIFGLNAKKYPSQSLKASLNTLCLSAASLGFYLYALNALISFVSDL